VTIAIPRRFREDPRQTGPASPNGATVTFRAAETSGLLFMLLTRYRPQVDGPENGLRGWWVWVVELHMVGCFWEEMGFGMYHDVFVFSCILAWFYIDTREMLFM